MSNAVATELACSVTVKDETGNVKWTAIQRPPAMTTTPTTAIWSDGIR